jgi:hypothetical protein
MFLIWLPPALFSISEIDFKFWDLPPQDAALFLEEVELDDEFEEEAQKPPSGPPTLLRSFLPERPYMEPECAPRGLYGWFWCIEMLLDLMLVRLAAATPSRAPCFLLSGK